jgi:hypothetical protein
MTKRKPKEEHLPKGRPSKFSQAVAQEIEDRLSMGEPLVKICKDDHMPSWTTVHRWGDESPDFRDTLARAKRERGTHAIAEEALIIADDPLIDPAHKRVMVDTRLRLIGHWNSKVYGQRSTQEHVGPDGGPIQLERKPVVDWQRLSPEAREAAKIVLLELKAQQEGNRDDE